MNIVRKLWQSIASAMFRILKHLCQTDDGINLPVNSTSVVFFHRSGPTIVFSIRDNREVYIYSNSSREMEEKDERFAFERDQFEFPVRCLESFNCLIAPSRAADIRINGERRELFRRKLGTLRDIRA